MRLVFALIAIVILDLLVDSLDVQTHLVLVAKVFLALGARKSRKNGL